MSMVYGLQGFITTQYARRIMSWGTKNSDFHLKNNFFHNVEMLQKFKKWPFLCGLCPFSKVAWACPMAVRIPGGRDEA